MGLRSPPIRKDRASVYRILIVGDSFAFGQGVDAADRFDAFLNELEIEGKQVEVVNSGVMGCGTDQQLLWFEREGIRLRPDLVVLMTYENDLEDVLKTKLWARAKPAFVQQNGELQLTGVPVPAWGWLRSHSYLVGFAMTKIAPNTARPIVDPEAGIGLVRALRDRLQRGANAVGIPLLPVLFSKRDSLRAKRLDWKSELVRDGVLDLDPTFLAERELDELYFEVDEHWNESGHRIVGARLRAAIGERRWQQLPSRPAHGG